MAKPVIVFDVNETLSDLSPLAQHFAEVGVPEELADSWFAGVLRDGFGLAAAGRGAGPIPPAAVRRGRSALDARTLPR